MNQSLINAVLLAWPAVVVVLFRVIGPQRAVLVGMLGGFLFLPSSQVIWGPLGSVIPFHKFSVMGLGLLLGSLIFDGRTLLRARPGWLDLPMAGYYLAPLIGLATGLPGSSADILDVMIGRGLGWVVPYAMGRIYFRRDEGPATVAVGLTIAGLSYIPVCLYEEIAGPSRYLAGLLYGMPYNAGMVDRLGGWRPEGFLGNGLDVALWMALTTVTAAWLWLGGWRAGRWPAWLPALALLLVTLSCRGVYGYLVLAIGLGSLILTRGLRTRAILGALLVLPALYIAVRVSGVWDGEALVRAASLTGRASTVDWRIHAENEVIGRVLGYNPIFGFGNYIWHAQGLTLWPDGAWVHAFWMGGFVGLVFQLMALHVWPAALGLARPRARPDHPQAAAPSWALAAWCILQMIDGLHNMSYSPTTALIAGTLVGFASRKGTDAFRSSPATRTRLANHRPIPVPLIVSVLLLAAIEILGRLPRSTVAHPSSPAAKSPP